MTEAVNAVKNLMINEDVSYSQNIDLLNNLIIKKYMHSKKIREFGTYLFIEVYSFKYNSRYHDSQVENRVIRKAADDYWKTQLDLNEKTLYIQYANQLRLENERINFRRNDLSSIMIDGTPLGQSDDDGNGGSETDNDLSVSLMDGSNFNSSSN
ncbi:hypothetical protein Glove_130g117 [Diversispora epigaea]|uniref:Uncharacterized protein n=1 Tax=Diversispora epigaea TaxID=1348612 RepID=A0A397J2H3_9GLOM|nr:hypothetical protein Glove_130g117 [Diversispora epigaea]